MILLETSASDSRGRRRAFALATAVVGAALFVGALVLIIAGARRTTWAVVPIMLVLGLYLAWSGVNAGALLIPKAWAIQLRPKYGDAGFLVTLRIHFRTRIWVDTSFPVYRVRFTMGRIFLTPASRLTIMFPALVLGATSVVSERRTKPGIFGREAVRLTLTDGTVLDLAGVTRQSTAQLEVDLRAALSS